MDYPITKGMRPVQCNCRSLESSLLACQTSLLHKLKSFIKDSIRQEYSSCILFDSSFVFKLGGNLGYCCVSTFHVTQTDCS